MKTTFLFFVAILSVPAFGHKEKPLVHNTPGTGEQGLPTLTKEQLGKLKNKGLLHLDGWEVFEYNGSLVFVNLSTGLNYATPVPDRNSVFTVNLPLNGQVRGQIEAKNFKKDGASYYNTENPNGTKLKLASPKEQKELTKFLSDTSAETGK